MLEIFLRPIRHLLLKSDSDVVTVSFPSSPSMPFRLLNAADLPALLTLSGAARWNQTPDDWRLLLELEPDGCLGIEIHNQIVASTTLTCYGDETAWLGMVLTHPDYRRRGLARRLVESALQLAEARRIKTVKLDATEQGLPLYRSLGFRVEQAIERWSARPVKVDGGAANARRPLAGAPLLALDKQAFGANRAKALQVLLRGNPCFVLDDGYAMARSGRNAAYFGPCIAHSAESARLLAASCFAAGKQKWTGEEWFWDLLPANNQATSLAEEFGFRPVRHLFRMVKGNDSGGMEAIVYAAGGFEIG